MRQLYLLFGFALSLTLVVGCGAGSDGAAQPAADIDEIQQFLDDNPEQDVDDLEDAGEDEDDLSDE